MTARATSLQIRLQESQDRRQGIEKFLCTHLQQPNFQSVTDSLQRACQSGPCTTVWQAGEVAYRCRTCQTTVSSAICVGCFRAGGHDKHDYSMYHSPAGGCCDCGDLSSWTAAGCCPRHQPYSSSSSVPSLPDPAAQALRRALNVAFLTLTCIVQDGHDSPELRGELSAWCSWLQQLCAPAVARVIAVSLLCRKLPPEGDVDTWMNGDELLQQLLRTTGPPAPVPRKGAPVHEDCMLRRWIASLITLQERALVEITTLLLVLLYDTDFKFHAAAHLLDHYSLILENTKSVSLRGGMSAAGGISATLDRLTVQVLHNIEVVTKRLLLEECLLESQLQLLQWCVEDWVLAIPSNSEPIESNPELNTALHCYKRVLMDVAAVLQHPAAVEYLVTGPVFVDQLLPLLALAQSSMGYSCVASGDVLPRSSRCTTAINLELYMADLVIGLSSTLITMAKDGAAATKLHGSVGSMIFKCMRQVNNKLLQWLVATRDKALPSPAEWWLKLAVGDIQVSPHLCLNRMLAILARTAFTISQHDGLTQDSEAAQQLLQLVVKQSEGGIDWKTIARDTLLLKVMSAQAELHMWVRNGENVMRVLLFQQYCHELVAEPDLLLLQLWLVSEPQAAVTDWLLAYGAEPLLRAAGALPAAPGDSSLAHWAPRLQAARCWEGVLIGLGALVRLLRARHIVGSTPRQRIRHLLLHSLAVSDMRHTQLISLLSQDLQNRPEVEEELSAVAVCTQPSLSQSAKYRLKRELWQEYSPHYALCNRADAQHAYERACQLGGYQPHWQLNAPSPVPAALADMMRCVLSPVVLKLVHFLLCRHVNGDWADPGTAANTRAAPGFRDDSDAVDFSRFFDEAAFWALNLLALALHHVNQLPGQDEDVRRLVAALGGSPHPSAQFEPNLLVILDKAKSSKSSDVAACAGWLAELARKFADRDVQMTNRGENPAQEAEEKRKAAKARQMAMLSRMKAQQAAFAATQMADMDSESDSELDTPGMKIGAMEGVSEQQAEPQAWGVLPVVGDGACLVCRERGETSESGPLSWLANVHCCGVLCTVLGERGDWRKGSYQLPDNSSPLGIIGRHGVAYSQFDSRSGLHVHCCGHLVHSKCYGRIVEGNIHANTHHTFYHGHGLLNPTSGEVLCPACSRVANCVLPAMAFKPPPNAPMPSNVTHTHAVPSEQPQHADHPQPAAMGRSAIYFGSGGAGGGDMMTPSNCEQAASALLRGGREDGDGMAPSGVSDSHDVGRHMQSSAPGGHRAESSAACLGRTSDVQQVLDWIRERGMGESALRSHELEGVAEEHHSGQPSGRASMDEGPDADPSNTGIVRKVQNLLAGVAHRLHAGTRSSEQAGNAAAGPSSTACASQATSSSLQSVLSESARVFLVQSRSKLKQRCDAIDSLVGRHIPKRRHLESNNAADSLSPRSPNLQPFGLAAGEDAAESAVERREDDAGGPGQEGGNRGVASSVRATLTQHPSSTVVNSTNSILLQETTQGARNRIESASDIAMVWSALAHNVCHWEALMRPYCAESEEDRLANTTSTGVLSQVQSAHWRAMQTLCALCLSTGAGPTITTQAAALQLHAVLAWIGSCGAAAGQPLAAISNIGEWAAGIWGQAPGVGLLKCVPPFLDAQLLRSCAATGQQEGRFHCLKSTTWQALLDDPFTLGLELLALAISTTPLTPLSTPSNIQNRTAKNIATSSSGNPAPPLPTPTRTQRAANVPSSSAPTQQTSMQNNTRISASPSPHVNTSSSSFFGSPTLPSSLTSLAMPASNALGSKMVTPPFSNIQPSAPLPATFWRAIMQVIAPCVAAQGLMWSLHKLSASTSVSQVAADHTGAMANMQPSSSSALPPVPSSVPTSSAHPSTQTRRSGLEGSAGSGGEAAVAPLSHLNSAALPRFPTITHTSGQTSTAHLVTLAHSFCRMLSQQADVNVTGGEREREGELLTRQGAAGWEEDTIMREQDTLAERPDTYQLHWSEDVKAEDCHNQPVSSSIDQPRYSSNGSSSCLDDVGCVLDHVGSQLLPLLYRSYAVQCLLTDTSPDEEVMEAYGQIPGNETSSSSVCQVEAVGVTTHLQNSHTVSASSQDPEQQIPSKPGTPFASNSVENVPTASAGVQNARMSSSAGQNAPTSSSADQNAPTSSSAGQNAPTSTATASTSDAIPPPSNPVPRPGPVGHPPDPHPSVPIPDPPTSSKPHAPSPPSPSPCELANRLLSLLNQPPIASLLRPFGQQPPDHLQRCIGPALGHTLSHPPSPPTPAHPPIKCDTPAAQGASTASPTAATTNDTEPRSTGLNAPVIGQPTAVVMYTTTTARARMASAGGAATPALPLTAAVDVPHIDGARGMDDSPVTNPVPIVNIDIDTAYAMDDSPITNTVPVADIDTAYAMDDSPVTNDIPAASNAPATSEMQSPEPEKKMLPLHPVAQVQTPSATQQVQEHQDTALHAAIPLSPSYTYIPPTLPRRPSLLSPPSLFQDLYLHYYNKPCPYCKKTPALPALCLVTGQFMCSWSNGCTSGHHLPSIFHEVELCGGTGAYLMLKPNRYHILDLTKCTRVVAQRMPRQTVCKTVYLDVHGEEDDELRRGKPLHLNRASYGQISQLWAAGALDFDSFMVLNAMLGLRLPPGLDFFEAW